MPIYEYFCNDCNVVFSFMSNKVAPSNIPDCPRCCSDAMIKHLSSFATPTFTSNTNGTFDEDRVESAFGNLLEKAEHVSEQDASEVGGLMESFTKECGYDYTHAMGETLGKVSSAGDSPGVIIPQELLMQKESNRSSSGSLKTDTSKNTEKVNPPEIDPNIYQL